MINTSSIIFALFRYLIYYLFDQWIQEGANTATAKLVNNLYKPPTV